MHFDIKAPARRQPHHPLQQIAVSNRNPPPIFVRLERDRVVQHTAQGVHDGDVEALVVGHAVQIAGCQQADQLIGIWAGDFHLPLTGDIPDLHRRFQVAVVFLEAPKYRWDEHSVVDGVGGHARGFDCIAEWRSSGAAGWCKLYHGLTVVGPGRLKVRHSYAKPAMPVHRICGTDSRIRDIFAAVDCVRAT